MSNDQSLTHPSDKTAVLYRMVMDKHVCPFGLKSKHLLKSRGYKVEDHWLTTRTEVDAFKAAHDVATTPQTFIDGRRIGGHTDLLRFFGKDKDPAKLTYGPVLWVFATAAAIALVASRVTLGSVFTVQAAEWFVAFSMMLLAMLKLQDIDKFSSMFLGYDLLARRWVPYAYAYPFLEWSTGALMAAGVLPWLSIPVALVIGGIGTASVYYAVYVQKRELKCACVGGSGNVPLGFVSLLENMLMVAMAVWMLVRPVMA
ncbi:MauE/DoxX family redox-associated membrane protein [Novosphingobium gossypii]|uniref:MauE/DoxX family redox-associated membrane protein n=1 Tax=Novosphingobium gossypii TaxID=1604774 RepID=UPI003D23B258